MSVGKRSISDNPCPESWEEMKNIPEGKFCGVCNTNVYDLSDKPLEEIESNFINKELCVKMTEEQVNALRFIHPIKRFAVAAFFIFGSSLFTISYGQVSADSISVHKPKECRVFGRFVYEKSSKQALGRTITIETETNKYSTESDEKGRYTFRVPHGSKIINFNSKDVDIEIGNKKSINLGKTKLRINRFGSIGCPSF